MRVTVVTLGCDKNTVDSEKYLATLASHGATPVSDASDADVIIVNTCGFIDAAKRESLDALIQAGQLKNVGSCRAVVGLGCMVERHRAELEDSMPEVDFFLGTRDAGRLIPELLERGLLDEAPVPHVGERIFAGELPHVRYLKVSEGCDHGCAFCAIPLMRGRHRSFPLREVISEAQLLEAQGAREVNLVAQDLAHYGRDVRDGNGLPELLAALAAETSIPWLRMLYLYSAGITPKLLDVVAREPRIVRYLDMPIQHGSDQVLARMRRPERQRTIRDRVARYRDAVPGLAIRTTCIVGFPGETESDFSILLDFLEEMQFDRVGAFTYSAQEGTRAAQLEDDVPDEVKRERLERLVDLQRAITQEKMEAHVGQIVTVLVDRTNAGDAAEGRVAWQADDIDGITRLAPCSPDELWPGCFVKARLTATREDADYDAEVVEILADQSSQGAARRLRSLPVMAGPAASFGR